MSFDRLMIMILCVITELIIQLFQVGIPLGLVMFQSIGERLNKFVSVFIRRAKIYIRCKQTEATETNLMLFNGMLSSIIITTGAAVFSRYEGWSYFDSFYYCFVTLTTIGFGDYVALQNDQVFKLIEKDRLPKEKRSI